MLRGTPELAAHGGEFAACVSRDARQRQFVPILPDAPILPWVTIISILPAVTAVQVLTSSPRNNDGG